MDLVRSTCQKYNVDPVLKGWIEPPPPGRVIAFKPTPELVHGVSVANPLLAKVLRDAGFFSGKSTNRSIEIDGDRLFLHRQTLSAHYQRLQDSGDRVE